VKPLAETGAIEVLERDLEAACGDAASIRARFATHVHSDFLRQFVRGELCNLALDPDHIVRSNAGQVNFTLINSPAFDYTIRLSPPFPSRPHAVKWIGERQIVTVKGSAGPTFRLLAVPPDLKSFQAGGSIEPVRLVHLEHGALLESDQRCILDVYEVTEAAILEVLTISDRDVQLHWTFDEDLSSIHAEASTATCSRIQNVWSSHGRWEELSRTWSMRFSSPRGVRR